MATKKTKVELSAETSKYEKSMRNVQRVSKKTSQDISKAWKTASIAVVAATAAMVVGFKSAIDAASDLQEVQGKFDVVFAAHKEQAEDMAKILVDSYAMSSREAKQYMSSIQDLLVPMGMASDKALLMSNEVVKLSADLGSFNNLPTAQVMLDIQSALVGNFETMKKYGVVLNETVIKQKALEMGLYSGKGMVDANTKAQIAYKLMLEGSAAAIGDQERTMGSYANQMKKLKAQIEDVKSVIGNKLLPEVTAWINQLNIMIEKNPQVIDQIGEFTRNILEMASAMGKVLALSPEFVNVWADTWRAMGLASMGVVTWETAMLHGVNTVKTFNEELGIEKLRLIELEKIMARTKDWPGVYTQEAYQKAKQEAEALRIIIASRKTLAGLKAPSRLDQALADPNKYYGGSAPEAPSSTTPDKLQRTKEYYKQLESLAQDSRNVALEIEDEETRMFR
ncbi:hypothetical protein KA005_21485, partial [bacterium]|nr:hypothetical protein [bacterium]